MELIVDCCPASLGIGIESSLLAKEVPVPVACGTDPVSLSVVQ